MELKSPISSLFLHAGKDLGFSPNQMPHPVPLLLTGNMAELAKAPKLQEPVDCPSGSICRLPGWRCRVRYFGLTETGHLRSPTVETIQGP
jgi:hypothetical protein